MGLPSQRAELLRQRALLQEHLAWLDRQIEAAAASEGSPAEVEAPSLNPVPGGVDAAESEVLADPLPRSDTLAVKEEVRRGCLLYFALACAVTGLAVLALFFAFG